MMDIDRIFLRILTSALHGRPADIRTDLKRKTQMDIIRLASAHSVLPMIVQASWEADTDKGLSVQPFLKKARELTYAQAQRTADFLVLYSYLADRGLYPVILKGIVVRSLYPCPEQRSSVDEDILIGPWEADAFHEALLNYGLVPERGEEHRTAQETAYRDRQRGLYIEVHRELLPTGSGAYSECNSLFEGALDRTVDTSV